MNYGTITGGLDELKVQLAEDKDVFKQVYIVF